VNEPVLTSTVRNILRRARDVAAERDRDRIGTEHVLLGLLAERGCLAVDLMRNVDVVPDTVRRAVESRLSPGGAGAGPLRFTQAVRLVLAVAMKEARRRGEPMVDSGHLLLALLGERDGKAAGALAESLLTEEIIREEAGVLRDERHTEIPAARVVHFVGLEDERFPKQARNVVAGVLAELRFVHDEVTWPDVVVAFDPEKEPTRKFQLGLVAAYEIPIALLLRPGDRVHPLLAQRVFRVPLDESLEANLRIALSA